MGLNIKAVIFDFDNTLEYWSSARSKCEKKILSEVSSEISMSYNRLSSAFLRIGQECLVSAEKPAMFSRAFWLKKAIESEGRHLSLRRIQHYTEKFWDCVAGSVRLYSGAIELLDFLKQKGIKLSLISDSDGLRKYKMVRISKLGIDSYFDAIITSDDSGFNKPHPKIFKMALNKLGVDVDSAVMVGDNPRSDCMGAKKLGIKTICVLRGSWKRYFSNPDVFKKYAKFIDYKFNNLEEVLSFFKKNL